MKEIFYKKVGRKYVPVQEYDSELLCSLAYGFHLVHVREGWTSYLHKIDPADAAVLAACGKLRDAMLAAMQKAAELELIPDLKNSKKYTKAYKEFDDKVKNTVAGRIVGRYNSRADLVDAAIKVVDDALRAK